MFADGILSGFEQLERQAAQSLGNSLKELDDTLYGEGNGYDEMSMEVPEAGNEHEFRRFDANMYEAHTDTVEAKEIMQWRAVFPFIRVVGEGYPTPTADKSSKRDDALGDWIATKSPVPPQSTDQNDSFSRSQFVKTETATSNGNAHSLEGTMSPDANLVIIGTKCKLHSSVEGYDRESEEDVEDGILEEVIAIDRPCAEESSQDTGRSEGGDGSNERVDFDPLTVPSPRSSRREEVISMLADAVWPDVVTAIRPLVEQVVAVSRANNITYQSRRDDAGEDEDEDEDGGVGAGAGAQTDTAEFMSLGGEETGLYLGLSAARKSSFDSDW